MSEDIDKSVVAVRRHSVQTQYKAETGEESL